MKNASGIFFLASAVLMSISLGAAEVNSQAKMHKFSTVIEKERPELDEVTKKLISEYRRNPTEANRAALRKQVEKRYDAVVERKKQSSESLSARRKTSQK